MDEKYLDILLKRNKEHYNTEYNHQYKCFPIKEELAEDFVKLVFDNDDDRLYFLQQYVGQDRKLKKAL